VTAYSLILAADAARANVAWTLPGNMTPPIGGLWTPGGPLLWSPVDVIDSVVSSGLATLAANMSGFAQGLNFGASFWAYRAGRACTGVRFRLSTGTPAVTVRCILWPNVQSSDGGTRLRAGEALSILACPGPGIYVASFSSPVPIVPGYAYVVSVRDAAGIYDSRVPNAAPWGNPFGAGAGSSAGGPMLATNVFGNTVPTLPGNNNMTSLVGGSGGDPTPDYCPSQSIASWIGIEPVLI